MIAFNSTHHKILKALEQGPKNLAEIQEALSFYVSEGVKRSISVVHLPALESKSIIVSDKDNLYHLTAKAKQILSDFANRLPAQAAEKVRGNLVSKLNQPTYDGAELKREAKRPGSMDFMKYPSIINGKKVAYK